MSDELFQKFINVSDEYLNKGTTTTEFIKGYLFGVIDMFTTIGECENYDKYIEIINTRYE